MDGSKPLLQRLSYNHPFWSVLIFSHDLLPSVDYDRCGQHFRGLDWPWCPYSGSKPEGCNDWVLRCFSFLHLGVARTQDEDGVSYDVALLSDLSNRTSQQHSNPCLNPFATTSHQAAAFAGR